MSYILNRSDGTILTELVDGILDQDTTDIALVGRNYTGYGEFINENFIKMLENFANTNVPISPLRGQLWYDTGTGKLKIYDGSNFVPASGSVVSQDQPQSPIAGDTWFDTEVNQLYLFDGDNFRLVGPQYTAQQGTSGIIVSTMQDRNLNSRTVLRLVVGDQLQAIVSREEFVPNNTTGNIIPELITPENPQGTIKVGINVLDPDNFVFRGSALRTERVVTPGGDEILAEQILRNDEDGVIIGSLGVRSAQGLTIGFSQDARFLLQDGLTIQTTRVDDDVHLVVNSSTSGLTAIDAVTVATQPQHVGIFQAQPQYTLDVGGDMRVAGNLVVEGTSTTINSTTLSVDDKNIEIAATPSPNDTIADGGGITLKGDTDKTLNWQLSTDAWTASENFDLAPSKEYRINNTKVLDFETLGAGVRYAHGLEQIGTLEYLGVENVNIDGSTISTINGQDMFLNSDTGVINVNNGIITMLDEPTQDHHAANKYYVDQKLQIETITFALDTTNWVAANTVDQNITRYLDAVSPATAISIGRRARIITTFYGQQTVTDINVALEPTGPTSVEYEDVESASTGGVVSVVQDIGLPSNVTGNLIPQVQRQVRIYEIVNPGVWQFQNIIPVTEV